MKHTSGPWIKSTTDKKQTCIRAAHGGLVATCEAGYQGMRDANALLIAAAPELLEALKLLTHYLSLPDGNDHVNSVRQEYLRLAPEGTRYIEQAKATIAKAEGK